MDRLAHHFGDVDQLHPGSTWTIGRCAEAACVLEATAKKAGNVHPDAAFRDMHVRDFYRSAAAVRLAIDTRPEASVGELIEMAWEATRRVVSVNTNLGILLLFAPLVVAWRRLMRTGVSGEQVVALWPNELPKVLGQLTHADADRVFRTISAARPGGLGQVGRGDVREIPQVTLLEAMEMAEGRDRIAWQYTHRFEEVFRLGDWIDGKRRLGEPWGSLIVDLQLMLLATSHDSLIVRKNGPEVADEVQQRACRVLAGRESGDPVWIEAWINFDQWLRADGNRRNPGTTADLIAAALMVALVRQWASSSQR
ncbi:MAG: triphosphoribosyl-dephospho-CoA synthase [Pirellulaceae bacterium]|jgi:triphosphoribosyl-dephospho-CoA synthase